LPATLPAAYEDLDLAFIHSYWTPEINTTRRNDHNARFRVTWGTFMQRHLAAAGQATQPMAGPAFFKAHPVATLWRDGFYAHNVAALKLAAPVIPVQAQTAATRSMYDASGLATQLAQTQAGLRPASAAQAWAKILRLAQGRGHLLVASSVAPRALLWPALWRFVTAGQDIRNVALSAHAAETPAYFLSRALILLSIRRELHTRHAMARGPRVAQAAHPTLTLVSVSAPLAQELASLACPGASQMFGRHSGHLLTSLHLITPAHASSVGATWLEG
jgi:hypothetical protein